ncbi:MAG: carbon-nitrogen hydrolase family protein [Clostridia bacterium]|nr:carbon-nitrogen hydrolase family protein [Clostridia bacterium]
MKIGAYQFAVSGNIGNNLAHMLGAVSRASREGVELLVFPECSVTGYPPLALPSPADIDETLRDEAHAKLQEAAVQNRMYIIAGTVIHRGSSFYNAALCFAPDGTVTEYDKRALWGWDRENFTPGTLDGILQIGSLKAGIRICFEVRFPEYFRELYREKTDLNILLFSDTSDHKDPDRYDLIRAHIRTRAVENVCPVLAVNNAASFQTAPTALFDASGKALCELESGKEGLLIFDFEKKDLSFGELGRKTISDRLI